MPQLIRRAMTAEYRRMLHMQERSGAMELGWLGADEVAWLEEEVRREARTAGESCSISPASQCLTLLPHVQRSSRRSWRTTSRWLRCMSGRAQTDYWPPRTTTTATRLSGRLRPFALRRSRRTLRARMTWIAIELSDAFSSDGELALALLPLLDARTHGLLVHIQALLLVQVRRLLRDVLSAHVAQRGQVEADGCLCAAQASA